MAEEPTHQYLTLLKNLEGFGIVSSDLPQLEELYRQLEIEHDPLHFGDKTGGIFKNIATNKEISFIHVRSKTWASHPCEYVHFGTESIKAPEETPDGRTIVKCNFNYQNVNLVFLTDFTVASHAVRTDLTNLKTH